MKYSFKKSFMFVLTILTLTFSALGVTPAYASSIVVDNNADNTLVNLAGNGFCDLREAIEAANTNAIVDSCASGASGADTITFNASLSGGTIYLASTLTLAQAVTIDGSALASQITISGDTDSNGTGDVRVFYVNNGVTATLNSLIITKGSTINAAMFNGGGVYNLGTLTVTNSTLSENYASFSGGGIYNGNTLTVTNSTFSGNYAASSGGGGIYNIGVSGVLTVANSTFSGNYAATASGGGIYNSSSTLNVTNSTFSGNSADNSGGGIRSVGTLNYTNTIIANSSGGDCDNSGGTLGTNTNNLVEDGSCSPSLSGDPNLGALASYGGPTRTFALLPGSPAIDAGDGPTCAVSPINNLDQRGATRPHGAACDIGSYEALKVTKLADTDDHSCDSNDCSLREAIDIAEVGDIIIFDSSLSGGTIALVSMLTLSQNVTIDGSALASKITISGDTDNDGTGNVRVFFVNAAITVNLNSLIITKGATNNGDGGVRNGGGISNNGGGTLTVTNSILSDNFAFNSIGGGIFSNGMLTVENSTFSGNSAGNNGGGISSTGTLAVTNSTFSGNSATNNGGGLSNSGVLTVTNSTLSGNSAIGGVGGGIYNTSGTVTVTNSTLSASVGGGIKNNTGTINYANTIVANSSSGSDCVNSAGTIGTNTNNLVEDGSCSPSLSGDPDLGVLANNGGSTQTFALLTGSPAIDAGDNTICAALPVSNLDQRGVTRPFDGNGDATATCDIGAYEYAPKAITAFSITSPAAVGVITGTNIAVTVPFGTNVTALAATFTTTGASVTVGVTPQVSGTTANNFTSPVTYTVTAADASTKDYIVTVTVAANPAKDITAFSFTSPATTGDIIGTNIAVTVPFGTNVTALVATFATTGTSVAVGATPQTSGTTANNFTSPVTYTVTAADASTKDYIVTVTVAANPAKDITAFSFTSPATTGGIMGTNIAVTVPFGTNVTALVATFTTTGASVKVGATPQVSGITANDFTNPVPYIVTAADASTQTYTVTVTIAPDAVAPTIISINRVSASPTSAASVDFTVTFSESVTGIDTTDFSLTTIGVSGAAVSGFSNLGSVYTVTVNTGSGSGTIRLDVPLSATITDLAGNPLDSLPYITGDTYTVAKTYNLFLPLILR